MSAPFRHTHHVIRPIGTLMRLVHWTLILVTAGLWYFVYRAHQKARGEK